MLRPLCSLLSTPWAAGSQVHRPQLRLQSGVPSPHSTSTSHSRGLQVLQGVGMYGLPEPVKADRGHL